MLVSRPRRVAATVVAGCLLASLSAAPLMAQKKDDKKNQQGTSSDQSKMTDGQRQELTPLVRTIDEVMKSGTAGTFNVTVKDNTATLQPDPAPVPLAWKNDFLKASNQLIYVPFVVSIEPGKMPTSVTGYLRVAPKGSTGAPAPAAGEDKKKKDDKDKKGAEAEKSPYPFEDVYFTELRPGAPGQGMRLTRAFAVPAGDYDIYLALREHAADAKSDAPVKITVLKQTLTIPNYWANEFTTSTVILADKVEPLNATLSPDQQRERPYVLGSTEIIPATGNKFKKTQELGLIFQVYGYQLGTDKKPDVQIEYVFHQKDATGEKPFNKTEPQKFSAQTLPPNFDPDQGHQIVGGQMIPLASFPEGDYRLEIKITDNKSTKTITRDVLFSVVPAS
jgi:hypothetical protein